MGADGSAVKVSKRISYEEWLCKDQLLVSWINSTSLYICAQILKPKKFWKIIGSSLIEFVKKVFATGQLPEGVNDSYIPLIPKLKKQDIISRFRPIGLCNLI